MAREPFNRIWTETPTVDDFDEPTEAMWDAGWRGGADQDPPEAYAQNWWQNRVDFALQDIERFGVMEYHASATYGIGGRARGSDGKFYLSVTTPNTGNDPVTDAGVNWVVDAGAGNNLVVFDAPGVTEWTVPDILSSGLRRAHVTVVGGGGAGAGNFAGGGGAGGASIGVIDLSGVTIVTVTVGDGGVGQSGTTPGDGGGDSSFGAFLSASGGAGGRPQADPDFGSGGVGGAGSGGDLNIIGGQGGNRAVSDIGSGSRSGGHGGSSLFGGGGAPANAISGVGAKGSGGAAGGSSPGNGAPGIVIVRW